MNVYRLADRLHKLPAEIRSMTTEDLSYFVAYLEIASA